MMGCHRRSGRGNSATGISCKEVKDDAKERDKDARRKAKEEEKDARRRDKAAKREANE